jgi:hypothetical protein
VRKLRGGQSCGVKAAGSAMMSEIKERSSVSNSRGGAQFRAGRNDDIGLKLVHVRIDEVAICHSCRVEADQAAGDQAADTRAAEARSARFRKAPNLATLWEIQRTNMPRKVLTILASSRRRALSHKRRYQPG